MIFFSAAKPDFMLFQPMSDYPLCLPISFTIGLRKIHLSVALRTLCTQSKKQNCFTYFRIADRISNILPDLHPGNLFPLPYFVNYFYCDLPFPRIFYFLAQINSDFGAKFKQVVKEAKLFQLLPDRRLNFEHSARFTYTQLILFPVLVPKKSGKTEKNMVN